ncbi:MAG: Phosphate--nucleotide phosphotransferase [uncultured Thiotrichaceae bacterium]|uniref:Phosphate--nucleotide phosphotransferase n=1 Tax=uncultured Thiotrichaceae bacterium TaxID=298394 RepID=A0A6S6UJL8_9GAMM|nr:MAG: Phosphate--nucleotide phosphotransferase [uncultured Thiotrichaceae bacterium]
MHVIEHPYRILPDTDFSVADLATTPPFTVDRKVFEKQLKSDRKQIAKLQHRLYAEDRRALLLVFQAMDAAGKDSTIRAVTKGINPAGCRVHSFKKPSSLELDHDFLWRTNNALPERGHIGIFNRSYYEETLVVRVHPKILQYQRLPALPENLDTLWDERFTAINAMEKHLVNNGTQVLKFWLNVSKEEQKQRFLSRLDEPEKHWKFSSSDVKERGHWDEYMHAYEQVIRKTSTDVAPWFAIPADNKMYMRQTIADIVMKTLQNMNPQFPEVHDKEKAMFDEMRVALNSD